MGNLRTSKPIKIQNQPYQPYPLISFSGKPNLVRRVYIQKYIGTIFFNIYVFISILISINSFALYVFWLEALDLFEVSIDEKGCVQYCAAQYFNMEMEIKVTFLSTLYYGTLLTL